MAADSHSVDEATTEEESKYLSTTFRHLLPSDRLGTSHNTFASFRKVVASSSAPAGEASGSLRSTKDYTTIVVTTHDGRRVLLGRKHRGFGTGLYNSFGGKVEPGEAIEDAAQRELDEETGISLPTHVLKRSHLGTLFFTFEDSPIEMVVHLFRVFIRTNTDEAENPADLTVPYIPPDGIRGCEEITPYWFDLRDIPLHTMFADDSVWLTRLLLKRPSHRTGGTLLLDGWFHFEPGGVKVNTIQHYYLDVREAAQEGVPSKRKVVTY
jgi:8-oxo-dGTP pyrophosphatase MutT (NUDIX family)